MTQQQEGPHDPTKAGKRFIYKRALNELIHDMILLIEREKMEQEYKKEQGPINHSFDISGAAELRGSYVGQLHDRTAAIKSFIVEELNMPVHDSERDEKLFYDLSNGIGSSTTEEVISRLRMRLGWLSEMMDLL
jgi:phosphomannomutase